MLDEYKVASVPFEMQFLLSLSTQVVSLVLLRWRIDTLSLLYTPPSLVHFIL